MGVFEFTGIRPVSGITSGETSHFKLLAVADLRKFLELCWETIWFCPNHVKTRPPYSYLNTSWNGSIGTHSISVEDNGFAVWQDANGSWGKEILLAPEINLLWYIGVVVGQES